MSFLLGLVGSVLLGSAPVPDTSSVALAVYIPVLSHAVAHVSPNGDVPVVVADRSTNWRCSPHCIDSTFVERTLSASEVEQLKGLGLIADACRQPKNTIGCPSHPRHIFVRLGVPFRLHPDLRVRPGGEGFMHVLAPDRTESETEPADHALDVLVFGPCPKGEVCKYQNIILYRYFVQSQPDGSFRVVARAITGMV